jgi:hypothetical protein
MIAEAEMIIEEFEKNPPIPTSIDDWINNAEKIMMYLTALKYMEAYG